MAVGVLGVLTLVAISLIYYSSANSRQAAYSGGSARAFDLAEAGANEALAVLMSSDLKITRPDALPDEAHAPTTTNADGSTVKWWGTPNFADTTIGPYWTITSRATTRNPSGAAAINRTYTIKVPFKLVEKVSPSSPAWNYVYAANASNDPNVCDVTIQNNANDDTRLYIVGNLCVDQSTALQGGPIYVKGSLHIYNSGPNSGIGKATSIDTRVETYIEGYESGGTTYYCKYGPDNATWVTTQTCGDTEHIFSKLPGSVYNGPQSSVSYVAPTIEKPVADYNTWYQYAAPGPNINCDSTTGAASSVPVSPSLLPVFDSDGVLNNSQPAFDLTPSTGDYTCRVGPASDPIGELSWNHTTKKLTVHGTVYYDGSVYMSTNAVADYDGQATFYMSGTLLLNQNAKLCAVLVSNKCYWSQLPDDPNHWSPNTQLLVFMAKGVGGIAGTGNSIKTESGAEFQGGLYADYNIEMKNNSITNGPMLGNTVIVWNNASLDGFEPISIAPPSLPGNPIYKPQIGTIQQFPN
jgi:hypothetical protein